MTKDLVTGRVSSDYSHVTKVSHSFNCTFSSIRCRLPLLFWNLTLVRYTKRSNGDDTKKCALVSRCSLAQKMPAVITCDPSRKKKNTNKVTKQIAVESQGEIIHFPRRLVAYISFWLVFSPLNPIRQSSYQTFATWPIHSVAVSVIGSLSRRL